MTPKRATFPVVLGSVMALLAAASASAAPRPDLELGRISEPPSAMSPGGAFEASAIVRNVGRGRAPSTTTRFYLSQGPRSSAPRVPVASRRTPRLRPGSHTHVSSYFRIPESIEVGRSYVLTACVDVGNRARESNERRNCFSSALFMTIVPR